MTSEPSRIADTANDSASARIRTPRDSGRPKPPARFVSGRFRIQSRAPLFILSALTLILFTLTFPPINAWPLAYVCLVPWIVAVCTAVQSRWLYFVSYLLGVAFFAVNVYWLAPVTAPGYAALCLYFGLAFPLAALPVRHVFRRYSGPIAICLPIAWVAIEYLRGLTLLGFPWYYLAHGHYRVQTMLQVADLAGALGLSFVIAMVNGWIADLLVQPILIWRRNRAALATRLPIGSAVTAIVFVSALLYGKLRLAESPEHHLPGPRVAILQQDFPLFVERREVDQLKPDQILEGYFTLAREAARGNPDLIVMPEGAWAYAMNREFLDAPPDDLDAIRKRLYPSSSLSSITGFQQTLRSTFQVVRGLADETGATLVLGANATEWRPDRIPERVERYNSAYVVPPGADTNVGRYDKTHLVLFGEFVPFRYSNLHGLYEHLNALTPWGGEGMEYSLSFGEHYRRFRCTAPSQGGRTFRFATPICYEDTVPGVIRRFIVDKRGEKQVDFLLSISNDGWFNHSTELEQHLAQCVFRAVEFRVAIARSVNTGISIFIDATGEIHDRVRISRSQTADFQHAESVLESLRDAARRAAETRQADVERRSLADAAVALHQDLPQALLRLTGRAAESPAPATNAAQQAARASTPLDDQNRRLQDAFIEVIRAAADQRAVAWRAFSERCAQTRETLGSVSDEDRLARRRGALLDWAESYGRSAVNQLESAGPDQTENDRGEMLQAWRIVFDALPDSLNDASGSNPANRPPSPTNQPWRHEYDYLRLRLRGLLSGVLTPRDDARSAAWRCLADQADADQATLARWRRQTVTAPGVRIAELACDTRHTLYARWGDWFSISCSVLTGLLFADWSLHRIRRRRRRRMHAKPDASPAT
ncbi:MAG: apolipoprotein N-acyltransferase [Phycisphaerae bacterium]